MTGGRSRHPADLVAVTWSGQRCVSRRRQQEQGEHRYCSPVVMSLL